MDLLINIDVDDLEAGAKFYQEALDLRRGRRLGDGVVELLGGSSPIYLLQKPTGSETSSLSVQRRDYSRHWTPVHLDFVVDDFDAAVSRALAAGARLEAPPQLRLMAGLRCSPIRGATAFACSDSLAAVTTKLRNRQ